MKVFISWSGDASRQVAETLQIWMRRVLQYVEPFISTKIEKGAKWGAEISQQLDASTAGIVCITPDNLDSRWLHFEAGALSKVVASDRDTGSAVWTYLFGVSAADVQFPLAQFQHTLANRDETLQLLLSINRYAAQSGERSLSDEDLTATFALWWPSLESDLGKIQLASNQISQKETQRSERELVEEVLEHVRGIRRELSGRGGTVSKGDIVVNAEALSDSLKRHGYKRDLVVRGADNHMARFATALKEDLDLIGGPLVIGTEADTWRLTLLGSKRIDDAVITVIAHLYDIEILSIDGVPVEKR